jgi:hypothetical protein
VPQCNSELTLHIGGAKCGSSAIQAYLRQNVDALADRNILLPGHRLDFVSEVTGEQIWAFENAATGGPGMDGLPDRLSSLMTAADERGARQIILSAENICNHPGLADVVARARGNRALKVVFYVRRQDDFLISSWQQWHLKVFGSLEAYLSDRVGRVGNWYSMITPWADAFGDDNVIVRPFVRDQLKDGDVVADFCDAAGLVPDGLTGLNRAANPSFDDALARLAHGVRDVFDGPHDNTFYEVMVRLLGKDALKKGSASSLLPLETRRRILARYRDENDALRDRFLPELNDRPLFRPPTEQNVLVQSDADKTSDDIAMLTRCVYALAQKLDKAS